MDKLRVIIIIPNIFIIYLKLTIFLVHINNRFQPILTLERIIDSSGNDKNVHQTISNRHNS